MPAEIEMPPRRQTGRPGAGRTRHTGAGRGPACAGGVAGGRRVAPRLPDTAYRFAEAYHECVRGLRGHLLTGAQALESAAGGLRATAREYLEVDAESARALQALVERAGPADAR